MSYLTRQLSFLLIPLAFAHGGNGRPQGDFVVECRKSLAACDQIARKRCGSDTLVRIDTSFSSREKLFQRYSECDESEKIMDPAKRAACGDQKSAWLNLKKTFVDDSTFRTDSVQFDRKLLRDGSVTVFKVRYSCDLDYLKPQAPVKEELEESDEEE